MLSKLNEQFSRFPKCCLNQTNNLSIELVNEKALKKCDLQKVQIKGTNPNLTWLISAQKSNVFCLLSCPINQLKTHLAQQTISAKALSAYFSNKHTLHFGLVMRKWKVLVFITAPKGFQNLVFLLMHHWNNVSITLHFSSEYK